MSDDQKNQQDQSPTARQPVFLLPAGVSALCALIVAVHLATLVLDAQGAFQLTVWFAYTPARWVAAGQIPGGLLPLLWTPVTHAFLHAGWEHLIVNVAWLAIFATPVARRYGVRPMIAVFLLGSAAGAAAFTATSLYDGTFLVGASGGVAALTGAALRFIFQPVIYGEDPVTGLRLPMGRKTASLREVFINPRSRWFTIVWVGLNALVPILPLVTGDAGVAIAWQAHLGGFALGLLIVPLFERRGRR